MKKVLVVDDEKDILVMLGKRLSSEGYSVVKADNGKKAVLLAREERPDLIILDILMPGMDGTMVAEALKAIPETKDIPVIFLTCLVSKNETSGRKVIGGKHFIAKPFDPEDLLDAVRKYTGS